MNKLGGSVIGFEETKSTSIVKGETLTDMIKVVENYCDIMVVRHPKEGTARLAAEISSKPVINAGDGANQHPTQTLLDLYTIQNLKGRLKDLNVALVGDLKYARVMKSLAYALAMFGANLTFVSPVGLEMPREIVDELVKKFDANMVQTDNILSGVKNSDVLYVCRIQKERFEDAYEAERMEKKFRITPEVVKSNEDMIILHSLPKVTEIDPEVDSMKNAKYFEQTFFGVPVRMALISLVNI